MSHSTSHQLTTRAVHTGARPPRPDFTPTVTPIYPSVTYGYDSMKDLDGVFAGSRQGYVYTRYGNPTVTALEEAIATLEEGEAALAFASGMAAIHAALLAVGARAGSAVVAAQDVYGATYALLDQLMHSQGVTIRFVDIADLDAVYGACAELRPVALLVETISNPLLKVADLPSLADIAHQHGAALLVDNTFASPCLVQPLKTGTDVVIHSTTKYLGGHGDVLSGVVVTSAARRADLFEIIKMTGANLGPQEAWLVLRGIRTLPLRMQQHCKDKPGLLPRSPIPPATQPGEADVSRPGLRRHRILRPGRSRSSSGLSLLRIAAPMPARHHPGRRLHTGALPRSFIPSRP
jgi:cystathionine beta-lyase/cystathionine gamma-synthase